MSHLGAWHPRGGVNGVQESGFVPTEPHAFPVRGVIINSLLWGLLYETWSARKEFKNLRRQLVSVTVLAKIQLVDCEEYANVDFSSYQGSFDYFAHLWEASSSSELAFHKLGTIPHEDTDRRDQAHTIMCEVAESIHAGLAGTKDEPNLALMGMLVYCELMVANFKLLKLEIDAALARSLLVKEAEVERVG
ncbi:hypothetical protein C8R45DRAFT_1145658 [Mycena sanguinolenta]|nr:hypothetical protein C8R45DRAFT_1145658 [Mycena sanguinolenta]